MTARLNHTIDNEMQDAAAARHAEAHHVSAKVTEETLDPARLLAEVAAHSAGASLLFLGTVRDSNDGRPVQGMDYRAYEAMASRVLRDIALEAADNFNVEAIAVEHRVGTLALGDASVAIAVSHAHRGHAFDACRYVIEQLKQRAPIWKLEHYRDGTREWVDPTRENVPRSGE